MTKTEGPYERGESIVMAGEWLDDDEITHVNPINPRLELEDPAGAITTWLSGALTSPSLGIREVEFTIPNVAASEGRWRYTYFADGPKPKATSAVFQVLKTE